jgi:hypothetical protein
MNWSQVATLSVTVLLALLGYFVTYGNNLRLAQRKDRLERVERQLREFYGPLLSLAEASTRVWEAFRGKYRPGGPYWGTPDMPSDDEAASWRMWMSTVFQPMNEEMARLVTQHADLIEEIDTPECLLDLYAHVAAYRPVLEAWKVGNVLEHTSLLEFPAESVLEYARKHCHKLKQEQALLLGKVAR